MIFEVGPNERCPCGSGKKWKKCHDPDSALAAPSFESLKPSPDLDLHLFTLANHVAERIEAIVLSSKFDSSDDARMFEQATIMTFASRAARVARSAMILLYAGQNGDAHALGRSLFDSWISTLYYCEHRRRATLYAAFQPFKQRRELEKMIRDNPGLARKFKEPIAGLLRDEETSVRVFPDIKRRKRSTSSDWKPRDPPEIEAMFPGIVRGLLGTTTFPAEVSTLTAKRQYIIDRVRDTYWIYSRAASQELHHTPLTLTTTLEIEHDGSITGLQKGYMPPTPLACSYCSMLIWVLRELVIYLDMDLAVTLDLFEGALATNRRRNGIEISVDGLMDRDRAQRRREQRGQGPKR